jgi:hypothetical protein
MPRLFFKKIIFLFLFLQMLLYYVVIPTGNTKTILKKKPALDFPKQLSPKENIFFSLALLLRWCSLLYVDVPTGTNKTIYLFEEKKGWHSKIYSCRKKADLSRLSFGDNCFGNPSPFFFSNE